MNIVERLKDSLEYEYNLSYSERKQLLEEIDRLNNKVSELGNINEKIGLALDSAENKVDRLNNIISQIETLVINHNCDTGDIYYKYNGKYLKSELKERIIELVELKENK